MAFLPSLVAAQAAGQHIICAFFVTFDFKSGPMYVWEGDGPLNRGGHDWRGIGHRQDGQGNPLQSIEGLEQAINGNAPQMTLTMSGVDSTVVAAASSDDPDEIEGRDLTVQIGFFDATLPGLVPLDTLLTLGVWAMQKPSFTATGPTLRTITLPAETLFAARSRAPFGLLTDVDQVRRFPGTPGDPEDPPDHACIFCPKLVDRDVAWPRH